MVVDILKDSHSECESNKGQNTIWVELLPALFPDGLLRS